MIDNRDAGLYIRLSEQDENIEFSREGESESIINQRIILSDYAEKRGFNIIKEYVDDGYSGLNFNRPSFQEMLSDLNNGLINTIIVKDLSRLGRDHVDTGYFIENYFPQNNIRFVSVMEKLDSANLDGYNDSVTFVMACNDFFSQQTSLKIKTALRIKARQGNFVGSQPCYGYMRNPDDTGKLIPNPDNDYIVKKIFKLALNGKTNTEISDYLNKKEYKTPSIYLGKKGATEKWNCSCIKNILTNKTYCGDLIHCKSGKASYKSDKIISNDRSKWIVYENAHEPLITRNDFDLVNNYRDFLIDKTRARNKVLLENLITCRECGHAIIVLKERKKLYIQCSIKSRTQNCYNHYMTYDKFEKLVLDKLEENNIINIDKVNRMKLAKKIDRIFIDKNKLITIILKNEKLKPLNIQYKYTGQIYVSN